MKIWFSLPCTKWCPWNSMNYKNNGREEQLETARRRERRLLWQVNQFIKETLTADPQVKIYFEWPTQCVGWSQHPMEDLREYMDSHDQPWVNCRIDGCRYGLREGEDGDFVQKRWTIKTNDENFHQVFRAKVCTGGHHHAPSGGSEWTASTYYPWKLVQSWCRFWRDNLVPTRHLRLLQRRDNQPADVDGLEDCVVEHAGTTYASMVEDYYDECEELTEDAVMDINMKEVDKLSLKSLFEEALVKEKLTFDVLESLMEEFFNVYYKVEPGHSRWNPGKGCAVAFGGYSHGAFSGISNATEQFEFLVRYVNGFFKQHQPQALWSSFMLNKDCKSLPHKDHHNYKLSSNTVCGFGKYEGGGLWLNRLPRALDVVRRRRLRDGTTAKGVVLNTRHEFVQFQPQELHATETWKGTRMVLSFYTTRLAPWMPPDKRQRLQALGFRLAPQPKDSGPSPTSTAHAWTAECLPVAREPDVEPINEDPLPEGIDKVEYQRWQEQIAKFHKAAGHPTNRNLAHIIKDAGHPEWKVQVAKEFYCPSCESLRPGGVSSGQVPPASTHGQFQAWEAIAVDSAEWIRLGRRRK
eukprot:s332_g7.t1